MVVHVVLKSAEDAGRLHCTTSLGAEDALDHDSTAHVEGPAVVADPVVVWDFIYTVTPLVNWDVASSTKDNQIFVLVVSVVADRALGVLLDHETSLVRAQRVVPLNVEPVWAIAVWVVSSLCKLLQNAFVVQIVFLLLPLFNVAQKFFFQL